jgi:hypothetical protein
MAGPMEVSITCVLGKRPTFVNRPAAVTVTPWLAGKVTLAFTFQGPDCVAPTVPETVAVPVVGNGNGLTMFAGAGPADAFAGLWSPFISTPAAASATTVATANTANRRFLTFMIPFTAFFFF